MAGTGAPVPQASVYATGHPTGRLTDGSGRHSAIGGASEVDVIVESFGLERTTARSVWDRQARVVLDLIARPFGDLVTSGSLEVCPEQTPCPAGLDRLASVTFRGPRTGTLRIDSHSTTEWPAEGAARLLCDTTDSEWNAVDFEATQRIGLFEVSATPSYEYVLEYRMPEYPHTDRVRFDYQVYLK